jgi:protein TonB
MYILSNTHDNQIPRITVAIASALVTTVILLFFMHRLIFQEFVAPDVETVSPIPDPIWENRPPPKQIFEPIPKPQKIDEPPETPNPVTEIDDSSTGLTTIPVVELTHDTSPTLINAGGSYPISQVFASPRYPERALRNNIEGWVDVQFDISRFGATENIRVLRASPEGYFERSALNAAKRWKYHPFKNDKGEAIPFAGLTKRLVFEIKE